MPRKSSKKTAASTASVAASSSLGSGIQSPLCTSTPIVGQRPSSPLSPTGYSRLIREAQTMVQTTQETVRSKHSREITDIKAMYEHELSDARELLDETVNDRDKHEIDIKRLRDDNEDLKSRLDKKTKDLQISEQNVMKFETRCNDLQSQFHQSQAERKKLAKKEREWEKEETRLKALLDDVRKRLEEETLQRIDLENNIQSLKEDIKVHQQEISETHARQQVEILDKIKILYEAKLKDYTTSANARIRDLKGEVKRMQNKITEQLQEYEDLMDFKVTFNVEFTEEKYRMNSRMQSTNTLLSTSRTAPSRHTPLRNGKQKRTLLEESEERSSNDYSVTGTAMGDVKIMEADPQGRFVKLTNKGSKEISLDGGLIIQHRVCNHVGSLETAFKIHRVKLEAGANVMVWLANVGASSNIVVKDQKWSIAHSISTKITNIEGEEMATPKRKRQQLSSTIILT